METQPSRNWFLGKCLIEHWFPGIGDAYDLSMQEFEDRLSAIRRIEKRKTGAEDLEDLSDGTSAEL